jgi:hypothetical protein
MITGALVAGGLVAGVFLIGAAVAQLCGVDTGVLLDPPDDLAQTLAKNFYGRR